MKKRISRDQMFIEIAHTVAKRGTCPRAKVGAVLVEDSTKRIRSIGYNGSPSGHPHCEDVGCHMEHGHCVATIHAEVNALQEADIPQDSDHETYTLYVTHKPCRQCTDVILMSGSIMWGRIARVVYDVPYRYVGPDSYTEGGVLFERYTESLLH